MITVLIRRLQFLKCHIHVHVHTYLLPSWLQGQDKFMQFRGKACVFSERAELNYSNLFWIFEKNREQENTLQRTDSRGCHFGFTDTSGFKVQCAHNK